MTNKGEGPFTPEELYATLRDLIEADAIYIFDAVQIVRGHVPGLSAYEAMLPFQDIIFNEKGPQ